MPHLTFLHLPRPRRTKTRLTETSRTAESVHITFWKWSIFYKTKYIDIKTDITLTADGLTLSELRILQKS
ncbi:hypothetical protein CAJAP_06507 [Camponotus japonicus]